MWDPDRAAVPPPGPRLRRALAPLAVALGLLAYGGALDGAFVFDDMPSITTNPGIRAGSFWQAAFGDDHSPISNRPLPCLTFVLNHAVDGLRTTGYHAVNLALHLLNVLLLLAVVRRALLAPNLHGAFDDRRATWTAAAVACLWAVHPLGCDAVVYITQRTTLLMATFLLTALLAVLRAATSRRRTAWQAAAVGAVALAMASKEESAAAPILIVLFERAFLLPSWSALRGRRRFHVLLAATWLVLLACVLLGPRNTTVGYDTTPRASAAEWLMTQAPVVVHSARLALWPHPLRGAYDWPVVRELGPVLLPGALIVGALVVTVLLWRRRPWCGWLGA
jgi:hypothetical protein